MAVSSTAKEDGREPVREIKWFNISVIIAMHMTALYTFCFVLHHLRWQTLVWGTLLYMASTFGVTGGAHRHWSHRSYKANLPLKIILMICYLTGGMYSILEWVRDHRVHHKFTDTDADPHNASRGFFFSHVGWLMQSKHPEVIRKGKLIDVSDILADPVIAFQQKYYRPLKLLFWFIIPVAVPYLFWGENLYNASLFNITRWVLSINGIWCINSVTHLFGTRPYNRDIYATQNAAVAAFAMGEGWHNYHHTFPVDYKADELGSYGLNLTAALIEMFSYIGWAYDLKQTSKRTVEHAVRKSGDGTHPHFYQLKYQQSPQSCDTKLDDY